MTRWKAILLISILILISLVPVGRTSSPNKPKKEKIVDISQTVGTIEYERFSLQKASRARLAQHVDVPVSTTTSSTSTTITPTRPTIRHTTNTSHSTIPPVQSMVGTSSHSGTFTATCYDLTGSTASGRQAGFGIVAVDPRVIPLGTSLNISGYGPAVAGDTGGAIKGYRIDVWLPTGSQCANWGVRQVTVSW